jgi:stalled ribosome rescue protein Dom34
MHSQTSRRAAVWLDQRKAMVLIFTDNRLTTQEEIYSNVDAHSGRGSSAYHIRGHHREALDHFYEAVIHHLGIVDDILILGPGQAKYGLRQHIKNHHHKTFKNTDVALKNASHMTTTELLARAEGFFELTRTEQKE